MYVFKNDKVLSASPFHAQNQTVDTDDKRFSKLCLKIPCVQDVRYSSIRHSCECAAALILQLAQSVSSQERHSVALQIQHDVAPKRQFNPTH